MDGLGRVFNVLLVADGVWVPMNRSAAVSFVCYLGAGDTFTIQEATALAGTGNTDLVAIDHYYTSDGIGGVWTKRTQTAAATMVLAGTAGLDCGVFTITGADLSDGFTHLNCTSTGDGTVVAILHDLYVARAPQNLAALA